MTGPKKRPTNSPIEGYGYLGVRLTRVRLGVAIESFSSQKATHTECVVWVLCESVVCVALLISLGSIKPTAVVAVDVFQGHRGTVDLFFLTEEKLSHSQKPSALATTPSKLH